MADAAVDFLFDNLKNQQNDLKKLITAKNTSDFVSLEGDLRMLEALLRESVKKLGKEVETKALVQDIRNLVYDVEDIVDVFFTQVVETTSRKISRSMRRKPNIQQLMQDVTVRVAVFITDFAFAFRKVADEPRPEKDAYQDAPIRENKVVGFEEEEKIMIDYIYEHTEELNVISIVGIPGQGKTTLAWKVYCNEQIGFDFSIRIWVNISQAFNMRDLLLKILKKFSSSPDASSLDDNELARIVRSCLEKEKFLLVLDDVWSVAAWKKIKEVLPEYNGQGKVLITTRQKDVGMQSRVHHNLKFLDEDESWELLQYEVFNKLDVCPPELEAIGYQIAIKCDGVPLTIAVIGGILADQRSKSPSNSVHDWKMVSKSVSEALQNDKEQLISDVVELSYRRLSDDLKECFVFLGVFPEDYLIPTKMLCRLWISEGFILPKSGRSLEEGAEENLNDLICRKLLKAEKTNDMGKVKACRVHDIIRAYCIKLSKKKNLFQVVKRSETGEFEPSLTQVKDSHRLCFRSDLSTFLSKRPIGPHVRSFLCFYDRPVMLESEYTSYIPDIFVKLRIMEFKCIRFEKFPQKVTKLIHLRYLTLFVDFLRDLPDAICQLWNLQALVVETQSRTITIKADLWRMIRLRYLKTKAVFVLDTNKWTGDGGENLHTLSMLAPESCTEAVAERAKNLRTLGISGKLTNIFETKFLQNLRLLEKLKLVNALVYEPTSEDLLPGLPHPNYFPPNLRSLTLMKTHLTWQNMSTLATVRSLEVLKLRDDAFIGVSWNVGGDYFPNLELLHISNLTQLVLWEAPDKAFPKLKFLLVKNCETLEEIPESVGAHLEKLEIERVRSSAVKSAQRIEKSKTAIPNGKFNLIIGPACGAR